MRFFSRLILNIGHLFSVRNLFWHLLAIVLTFGLVSSGFDWYYFVHTRSAALRMALFPAVGLGVFVPVLLPIIFFVVGYWRKNADSVRAAWTLVQAEIIALLLSFFYKAFTGRVPPRLAEMGTDISHMFRLGSCEGECSGAGPRLTRRSLSRRPLP